MTENTQRFTQHGACYAQSRPSYPRSLIDYHLDKGVIGADLTIADIGSGTGIFTKQLLDVGSNVFAVEPNQSMREIAQQTLNDFPGFHCVDAPAENTTLPQASVDAITVATAFHWFDRAACYKEFKRILKPNGWVALVWNLRLPELSSVNQGYDNIVQQYCPDYKGLLSLQCSEKSYLDFFQDQQN